MITCEKRGVYKLEETMNYGCAIMFLLGMSFFVNGFKYKDEDGKKGIRALDLMLMGTILMAAGSLVFVIWSFIKNMFL